MFTGLVEDLGRISRIERTGASARVTIETKFPTDAPTPGALPQDVIGTKMSRGDSIACDGVCLTVVEFGGGKFSVDVSEESLSRSTLGDKKVGDAINLERAMQAGARMGGHIVQGHVDGTGKVKSIEKEGAYSRFTIDTDKLLMPYFVEKGSVALDGVSLTINGLTKSGLWVMLIPETLSATTLGRKKAGDGLNVEVDVLAKYVERLLETRFSGGADSAGNSSQNPVFSAGRLREEGF